MTPFARDIVAFCRCFLILERDVVCCGTVSVAQCVVLQTLRDGPQDVSTLARELAVTKGAVTRLVDGLDAKGYVRRERDAEDRRRVFVALTEAGREEAVRLLNLTEGAVRGLLERVPAERHDDVMDAMRLLREAVDATISARSEPG